MLVSLRLDQFNKNNIKIGEKVENNIINNSYFLRINYNNSFSSINGIYLFFTLEDVKIKNTNFIKVGYYFNKNKNKSTVDNLISIENQILKLFPNQEKNKVTHIKNQLNQEFFKVYNHKLMKNKFILKISGLWENEYEYGLSYKFIGINHLL